jgi:branched-subunit amino acid ABC-type transport system permease component
MSSDMQLNASRCMEQHSIWTLFRRLDRSDDCLRSSLPMLVELVADRGYYVHVALTELASLISAIGVSIALLEGMRIITISRPMTTPRLLDKWSFGQFHGANFRIDTMMAIVVPIIIFVALDRFVTKSTPWENQSVQCPCLKRTPS